MRRGLVALVIYGGCHSQPAREPAPIATTSPHVVSPKTKRIVVTDTDIGALEPITFLKGSPTMEPNAPRILDAVADTFIKAPSILRVIVTAYGADALPQFQARLGQERAQAIVDGLVARGVERSRLEAEGFATPPAGRSTMPIFLIVERQSDSR